jgi:hypothetical protein
MRIRDKAPSLGIMSCWDQIRLVNGIRWAGVTVATRSVGTTEPQCWNMTRRLAGDIIIASHDDPILPLRMAKGQGYHFPEVYVPGTG